MERNWVMDVNVNECSFLRKKKKKTRKKVKKQQKNYQNNYLLII